MQVIKRFLVTEKILFSKMGIGVVFISELVFSSYGKSFGSSPPGEQLIMIKR